MTATIYVIVLLTASVLLLLIYRYDMYDREPWYMILLTVFLGGASAWSIGYVEDWLIVQAGGGATIAGQALIAAVCEEACKVAIILFVALAFRRYFNDPMDGIVYGALAGLGFALEESRFYLELAPHMIPAPTRIQLFGQESIRLILHFLTGGLDGFGIGLIWAKVKQGRVILIGWLGASLGIHYLWDYACGLPQDSDGVWQRSTAVLLMVFALILFGIAVMVGNLWSATAHPNNGSVPPLVRWPFTLLLRPRNRNK